ncbi:hypothetical protein IU440_19485 [Nocardia cyriacigeorgica]|uniref:hypothetical protein n=1 Tax=Nocardia cyriacigeorgica TaxID=135487 RepID=UPI00189575AB|nr:hypothetical protein [Nocardia cyriacigeorgica]MBF6289698.1 hypothetical protein [Nocardia cyriacigeorgica]MBF6426870.1 hypothetical protein [Nocardia cyriacigeorgica]
MNVHYAPHGGHPRPRVDPNRMPGKVRTAQVMAWVAGAIGVAASVGMVVVTGDPIAIGVAILCFGIQMALSGCAFLFREGGEYLRIVLIVLSGALALQAMASGLGRPPGLLGLLTGILICCLMVSQDARLWFGRARP